MNKENQDQGNKIIKRIEKLIKDELLVLIRGVQRISENETSLYYIRKRQTLKEQIEILKRMLINIRGGNNNE